MFTCFVLGSRGIAVALMLGSRSTLEIELDNITGKLSKVPKKLSLEGLGAWFWSLQDLPSLALQFEWNWQKPHSAQRNIREEFNKNRKAPQSLKGRTRSLKIILSQQPWCHMPLKIQVLSDEYFDQIRKQLSEDEICLPNHVDILQSNLAELPVGIEDIEENTDGDEAEDDEEQLCPEENQEQLASQFQVLEDQVQNNENNQVDDSDEDNDRVLEIDKLSASDGIGIQEDNETNGKQKNKCLLCKRKLSGNKYKCQSCEIVSHISCLADYRLQGQVLTRMLPDDEGVCPHCGEPEFWFEVLQKCSKDSTWGARRSKQTNKKFTKRKVQNERNVNEIRRRKKGKYDVSVQVDENAQYKNEEQSTCTCQLATTVFQNQDPPMLNKDQDEMEIQNLKVGDSTIEHIDDPRQLNTDFFDSQLLDENRDNMDYDTNQNIHIKITKNCGQDTPIKDLYTNIDTSFSKIHVTPVRDLKLYKSSHNNQFCSPFQLQFQPNLSNVDNGWNHQNEEILNSGNIFKTPLNQNIQKEENVINLLTTEKKCASLFGISKQIQNNHEMLGQDKGTVDKNLEPYETPENQKLESIINLMSTENKFIDKNGSVLSKKECKNVGCNQNSNVSPGSVDLLSMRKADYLLKEYNFSFLNRECNHFQQNGLFQFVGNAATNSNQECKNDSLMLFECGNVGDQQQQDNNFEQKVTCKEFISKPQEEERVVGDNKFVQNGIDEQLSPSAALSFADRIRLRSRA